MSEKFSTQIGPKSFTIDRLMAIFYAINVNKVPVTSDLMMQISNLVRLKYLAFVSGESNIMDGTARLQCNVTLNFIAMVCIEYPSIVRMLQIFVLMWFCFSFVSDWKTGWIQCATIFKRFYVNAFNTFELQFYSLIVIIFILI